MHFKMFVGRATLDHLWELTGNVCHWRMDCHWL